MQVKLCGFDMAVKVIYNDEYVAEQDSSFPFRWAAPEVMKRNKFSTKSDIWTAGLLFWEIVNDGKLPFENLNTNEEVERAIKSRTAYLPIPDTHQGFFFLFTYLSIFLKSILSTEV